MKRMPDHATRLCYSVLVSSAVALAGLAGCAKSGVVSTLQPTDEPKTSDLPELINHTPFPTTLLAATDDSGRYFYSFVIKVTLKPYSNGHWRLDQVQEEITGDSVMSTACPGAPEHISDLVAFRETAEIFIRPNVNRGEPVTLTIGDSQRKIHFRNGCRVYETPQDLLLAPYLDDGTRLSLKGLNGSKTKSFVIPKGLMPFILVRYLEGQMIFTPTRLDTATLDAANDRMVLVYRATVWTTPHIRKVEYMAVMPEEMRDKADTRELKRDKAFEEFFKKCPKPKGPGEPCSSPDTPQERILFGVSD